jgi:SAM-dependent methyltransferase
LTHTATEQRTFEQVVEGISVSASWVSDVMTRIGAATQWRTPDLAILEIGSAAGANLAALNSLGYTARGVEPWEPARRNAHRLARHLGIGLEVDRGRAEELQYDSEVFDLVLAFAVMEHVDDIEASLAEISRVLKPRGGFWFSSASSMSPRQFEIRRFPLFGWYPDRLKRAIMIWARDRHPKLIGNTTTPAMHWFTPRKAQRVLTTAGFSRVLDRWDLRLAAATSRRSRFILRIITAHRLTRAAADVVVPGCSYLAIKP